MPPVGLARVLLACVTSLALYLTAFAGVLDRPLTLGYVRARIDATLAAGRSIETPKLIILAGSNGPYSHRCEVIGPIAGRPCVNAGVAVGIGLDYLLARWKPLLHPGDIVYMPLEEAQYVRSRATAGLGPDAAIMLRHDRQTLWSMPAERQLAAFFVSDLRAAIMSLIETALTEDGFRDPRADTVGGYNWFGDHIGHTAERGSFNRSAIAAIVPFHPTAMQIAEGHGSVIVIAFLQWAEAQRIRVIGGLPTGFIDSPIANDRLAAIRAIYRDHGADFLELPNRSRYDRASFFDTQDHLNEPAQIVHSTMIGQALAGLTALISAPTL